MAIASKQVPHLAAMDLVAFVVLALGIGLTAGIVLGGAVLLLNGGDGTAMQAALPATAVVAH